MAIYNTVLDAVYLASESKQVLQAAADIAAQNNAEIAIIHVTDNRVTHYS